MFLILLVVLPLLILFSQFFYFHESFKDFLHHSVASLELKIGASKAKFAFLVTQNTNPVDSLPPEILARIFEFVRVRLDDHAHNLGGIKFKPNSILPVTWVCRRWRAVALDHAVLWTQFDESNATWAVECLKRSKRALLDVRFTITEDHLSSMFLLQLPRIRRLSLHAEERSVAPTNVWLQRASHLEALYLCSYTLPLDAFLGGCPKLRELYLDNCVFRWTTPRASFANLTTLCIASPKPKLAIYPCLQVLRNMMSLEWLTLRDAFAVHEGNLPTFPSVGLPSIKTICLDGLSPTIARDFICQIQLPFTGVTTFVACNSGGMDPPNHISMRVHQDLLNLLLRRHPTSTTLRVVQRYIGPKLCDYGFRYGTDESPTTFVLGYRAVSPLVDIPNSIFPQLHYLEHLRTLVLRFGMLPPLVWREVIAPLPRLEHLEISRAVSTSFHEYICGETFAFWVKLPPNPSATGTSRATAPFPSLKTLKYIGLPFIMDIQDTMGRNLGYQRMRDFFAMRMEKGDKLRRVILAGICDLERQNGRLREMIDTFQGVVQEVIVTSSCDDDLASWLHYAPA